MAARGTATVPAAPVPAAPGPVIAPAHAARPHMAHAFWWGMFAVGGMAAAVLAPIHILLQGVLGPLGVVPVVSNRYETFAAALANPLVKLYLLALIGLPLFHAAHRLRYLILDLGLHGGRSPIAVLMYGGAVVGTLAAAFVLFTTP